MPKFTEAQVESFRSMFTKYCNMEIANGRCEPDGCEFCPVNEANMMIFDTLDKSLEED